MMICEQRLEGCEVYLEEAKRISGRSFWAERSAHTRASSSNMPEMLENHTEVSAARTEGRAREGRNEDRRGTEEMGEIV